MNEQELLNKILSSSEGRQLLAMLSNNNNVNAGFNNFNQNLQGFNYGRQPQCQNNSSDGFGDLGFLLLLFLFFCGGCWF
jgi:hypothetical protein